MAVLCDGQHEHDSWGMVKDKWATSLETAYPWPLAKAMAQCVQSQLESAAVSFPDLDHVVQASRAYSGVQTRKRLPSLVPGLTTDYPVPSVRSLQNCASRLQGDPSPPEQGGVGQCSDHVEGSRANAVHSSDQVECMVGQCSDHVQGSSANAVHSSDQVERITDSPLPHSSNQVALPIMPRATRSSPLIRLKTWPIPPRATHSHLFFLGFSVALKNPAPSVGAHAVVPRPLDSAAEAEVVAFDVLSQGSPVSTAQVRRLFDLMPDSDRHASKS